MRAFHPLNVAENDSRSVDTTYLKPNSSFICLNIFSYPLASVLPPSTSASGLNPRQSSASSSFPMHTSTYFIRGRMIEMAFSLVHSFLRKLRSTLTVTPWRFAASQARRVSSAALSDIAGVMPDQWNHCAPSMIASKSKSEGSASAIAL